MSEENPSKTVTPEWLEELASGADFTGDMLLAEAISDAAQALRAEQGKRRVAEGKADGWAYQTRTVIAENRRQAQEIERLRAALHHHYHKAMRDDPYHRCAWRDGLVAIRDSTVPTTDTAQQVRED